MSCGLSGGSGNVLWNQGVLALITDAAGPRDQPDVHHLHLVRDRIASRVRLSVAVPVVAIPLMPAWRSVPWSPQRRTCRRWCWRTTPRSRACWPSSSPPSTSPCARASPRRNFASRHACLLGDANLTRSKQVPMHRQTRPACTRRLRSRTTSCCTSSTASSPARPLTTAPRSWPSSCKCARWAALNAMGPRAALNATGPRVPSSAWFCSPASCFLIS
jgi:hypothetical protein